MTKRPRAGNPEKKKPADRKRRGGNSREERRPWGKVDEGGACWAGWGWGEGSEEMGKGKGKGRKEMGARDEQQFHNITIYFFNLFCTADSGRAWRGQLGGAAGLPWGWFEAALGPARPPASVCQAPSVRSSLRSRFASICAQGTSCPLPAPLSWAVGIRASLPSCRGQASMSALGSASRFPRVSADRVRAQLNKRWSQAWMLQLHHCSNPRPDSMSAPGQHANPSS